MPFHQNYYSPVDVAIRWGHYLPDEQEILQIATEHPERLLCYSTRWPLLSTYLERLLDAIDRRELPASFLGNPLPVSARRIPCATRVRTFELRRWILRVAPDDKPDFLFAPSNDHGEYVSVTAYLVISAELDAAKLTIARQSVELARYAKQHPDCAETGAAAVPLDDSAVYWYEVTIGALLIVTIGKSADGQVQSIYKNQAQLAKAIQRLFPEIAGLKKHTLDRKFSAARKRMATVR